MSENFRRASLLILPVAGAGLGLFGGTELQAESQRHAVAAASASQPDLVHGCRAHRGDPALAGSPHRVEGQRLQPGSPSQSPAWWQHAQADAERCLRDQRTPQSG